MVVMIAASAKTYLVPKSGPINLMAEAQLTLGTGYWIYIGNHS